MNTKLMFTFVLIGALRWPSVSLAQANPSQVPGGRDDRLLPEAAVREETELNFDQAAESYRKMIRDYEKRRSAAAQAMFRLAEIHLKKGDKDQARALDEQIVRQFPDLPEIADRAAERLKLLGVAFALPRTAAAGNIPAQKKLTLEQIAVVDHLIDDAKKADSVGQPNQLGDLERQKLQLQRQLAALDGNIDRQKQILQEEIRMVQRSKEIAERRRQYGQATEGDILQIERQVLDLKRELAKLDSPAPASTTTAAVESSAASTPSPAVLPALGATSAPAKKPGETRLQEIVRRAEENEAVTERKREVQRWLEYRAAAQEEVLKADGLLRMVRNSSPDVLPKPASADSRYRELKSEFERAVLEGAPEREITLRRQKMERWVKQIYIPELMAQTEAARDELQHAEGLLQEARAMLNAAKENAHP